MMRNASSWLAPLALLLCAAALGAAGSNPNQLTAEEQAAGFRLLFDGESVNGWFPLRPDGATGEWTVEDGCLTPHGQPRELATKETFASFELRFDWKIAAGGNSGVLYRVEQGHHPPTSGPEYQLLDDETHQVRNIPDRRTAAAYGIYPPDTDATRQAGEWNTSSILVRGNQVEHWLNGVRVVSYELGSEDWKARVANSKFAKQPQYGAAGRGHIVLQDHGSAVWFRNLRVRELR